jgi:hypothetical protein
MQEKGHIIKITFKCLSCIGDSIASDHKYGTVYENWNVIVVYFASGRFDDINCRAIYKVSLT